MRRRGGIERGLPEQRVGRIDSFYFNQCCLPIWRARHGAHGCRARNPAVLLKERPFIRRGFPLDQGESKIAAENDAAFPRKSFRKDCRQRADTGDGHAAECNANDEDIETVQATAHFAQGVSQGEPVA